MIEGLSAAMADGRGLRIGLESLDREAERMDSLGQLAADVEIQGI